MNYVTVGKKYNAGKVALAKCIHNANLDELNIKDRCFLLIVMLEGKMSFSVANTEFAVTAPSFVCFNEKYNPILQNSENADYYALFFSPAFLKDNCSFEMLRAQSYVQNSLFSFTPFLCDKYVLPICDSYFEKISSDCENMERELTLQRDWYWSCRGRSYFLEIMIALERMYSIVGEPSDAKKQTIKNDKLREAILYIESRYANDISLSDIVTACGLNHTTLTKLMKSEMHCTVMKYLTDHRIFVAKKLLIFTEVPIKDICDRVGFKTVQHFSRVFKKYTDKTPALFRKEALVDK